jgi:nitrate reductase NapE component
MSGEKGLEFIVFILVAVVLAPSISLLLIGGWGLANWFIQ